MIEDEVVIPAEISKCSQLLFNSLESIPTQKDLKGRLITRLEKTDGEVPASFFEFFGEELCQVEEVEESKSFLARVFVPIVRKRNPNGLDWLIRFFKLNPEFVRQSDENDQELWVRRIQDDIRVKNLEEDLKNRFEELARLTEVEIPDDVDTVDEEADTE